MKKDQGAGPERILGRKLARELRGEELEKVKGQTGRLQPITTTTEIQPPDSRTDGYVA